MHNNFEEREILNQEDTNEVHDEIHLLPIPS